jgi:hypothetical protein
MTTDVRAVVGRARERPIPASGRWPPRPSRSPLADFEKVYLRNVDALMGYFARRCREPHTVADLACSHFYCRNWMACACFPSPLDSVDLGDRPAGPQCRAVG